MTLSAPTCWRCEQRPPVAHDPFAPDGISICIPCAIERANHQNVPDPEEQWND